MRRPWIVHSIVNRKSKIINPHGTTHKHHALNMTNTQAHQFVARWRRILIPWFAKTETEALRDMERSCIGMLGGAVLVFVMASTRMSGSFVWQAVAILGGVAFLFALVLVLRCRSARRALCQS